MPNTFWNIASLLAELRLQLGRLHARHALVLVAMRAELVAAPRDLVRELGRARVAVLAVVETAGRKEERRLHAGAVEQVEQVRRRARIRTVVEREVQDAALRRAHDHAAALQLGAELRGRDLPTRADSGDRRQRARRCARERRQREQRRARKYERPEATGAHPDILGELRSQARLLPGASATRERSAPRGERVA